MPTTSHSLPLSCDACVLSLLSKLVFLSIHLRSTFFTMIIGSFTYLLRYELNKITVYILNIFISFTYRHVFTLRNNIFLSNHFGIYLFYNIPKLSAECDLHRNSFFANNAWPSVFL